MLYPHSLLRHYLWVGTDVLLGGRRSFLAHRLAFLGKKNEYASSPKWAKA
jgi:hypothetical protein